MNNCEVKKVILEDFHYTFSNLRDTDEILFLTFKHILSKGMVKNHIHLILTCYLCLY